MSSLIGSFLILISSSSSLCLVSLFLFFLKCYFFSFWTLPPFTDFSLSPWSPLLSPAGFSSSSNFSGVRSPDVVHGSHFLNFGNGFNDQLNDDDFHIRISVQALSPELRNLISHNLLDWFPDAPFSTSNWRCIKLCSVSCLKDVFPLFYCLIQ